MKEINLTANSPIVGQKDPITRAPFFAGETVIECDKGLHHFKKDSWDYTGGVCSLCGTVVDQPIKKGAATVTPPAPPPSQRPPDRVSSRVVFTGSAIALLAIAAVVVVAIGAVLVVASGALAGDDNDNQSADTSDNSAPIRETVIVRVVEEDDDEPIIITATRERDEEEEAAPAPTSTRRPTSTPKPDVPDYGSCPGARNPRLIVGETARVTITNGLRVFVRSSPSYNASALTRISEGTRFNVVGGPECDDGWWWQIELSNGTVGWAVESSSEYGYHLEPYP